MNKKKILFPKDSAIFSFFVLLHKRAKKTCEHFDEDLIL